MVTLRMRKHVCTVEHNVPFIVSLSMAAVVICSSRCRVSVMKVLMLRDMMKGALYNTVWWYCAVLRISQMKTPT